MRFDPNSRLRFAFRSVVVKLLSFRFDMGSVAPVVVTALLVACASALNNGLLLTPNMGYNSWYDLMCTQAMNEVRFSPASLLRHHIC